MKKILFYTGIFLFFFASLSLALTGVKKRRPLPYEYGRVELNNFSKKAGRAAVVFDHWLHRAKFTCRLCHVDIGFAMTAGTTGIMAADNMQGYYCGACHNGETAFPACTTIRTQQKPSNCDRCHSLGLKVAKQFDFRTFTEGFPKGRFGNGIDWEKAEETGKIAPMDFLAGVSIQRDPLDVQKDFGLKPKVESMPEIIFSHKKHTVWNGCELCHPEIFIGVKKGATQYSMVEIYAGKYCGICHSNVAFPLLDCQRCHAKPMQ
jgi:c(7)-type cytochrome triheme protein